MSVWYGEETWLEEQRGESVPLYLLIGVVSVALLPQREIGSCTGIMADRSEMVDR